MVAPMHLVSSFFVGFLITHVPILIFVSFFFVMMDFFSLIAAGNDAKDDALLAEKYNIGTGFDVLLFSMIVR